VATNTPSEFSIKVVITLFV